MNDDLRTLLTQAEDSMEQSIAAADAPLLRRLAAATRRRRLARRARTASIGVITAAALTAGIVAWPGLGRDTPRPALTPDPSPTMTTSPSPTPTATADIPAGPPTRAEHIDDATVIARLSNPRTGEIWTTPEPAPEVSDLLTTLTGPFSSDYLTAFHVGHRGDAQIYMTFESTFLEPGYSAQVYWAPDVRLFEIDGAGAREILCPSARSTDPCAERPTTIHTPGLTLDDATFYDTFTLPRHIPIADGFTLSTVDTSTRSLELGSSITSVDKPARVLRELGSLQIVQMEDRMGLDGLTNIHYALTTPFGTTVAFQPSDVPGGDFAGIVWDDGVVLGDEPPDVPAAPAGSRSCTKNLFSVEDHHVSRDWRVAGTTADGHRVHVPVTADVQISRAVRAHKEELSFTLSLSGAEWVYGAAAGYPYLTDLTFHEARALFAIQGPGGEWQLRIRPDADSVIYECA